MLRAEGIFPMNVNTCNGNQFYKVAADPTRELSEDEGNDLHELDYLFRKFPLSR
jgi:hypothetical protein